MPLRRTPNRARGQAALAALAATTLLAACVGTPGGPSAKAVPSAGKAGNASLVSKGGANVVTNGGSNLVSKGGANVVTNGGGNLVTNGGGNLVTNGGNNVVTTGGSNAISNNGASFTGPHASFALQLQDLAAIGHNRAAAQIIATNGAGVVSNNTGGLIANNAGSLLANNAAGLIGNNAGGLVANNAAGLVTNGGGNAISNNGASYALAQLAAPAFALAPADGEAAAVEAPLPDQTTAVVFDRADGSRRIVVVNAARRPLEQQVVTQIVDHPNGVMKSSHTERDLVYGNDQRRRGHLAYDETYDDQGRLLTLTHQPSDLEEPNAKLKIAVKALAFTVEPASGGFELAFEHLGAVEKGTFTQVTRNVQGKGVGLDLTDPLGTIGGQSRMETTTGTLLFERKTTITATEHRLQLTLRDGYALDVARAGRTAPYQGALTLDGKAIGTVKLTTRADASVTYEVAFDGDAAPITVNIPDAAAAAQP